MQGNSADDCERDWRKQARHNRAKPEEKALSAPGFCRSPMRGTQSFLHKPEQGPCEQRQKEEKEEWNERKRDEQREASKKTER